MTRKTATTASGQLLAIRVRMRLQTVAAPRAAGARGPTYRPDSGYAVVEHPIDDDWLAAYYIRDAAILEIRVLPMARNYADARHSDDAVMTAGGDWRPPPPELPFRVRSLHEIDPLRALDVARDALDELEATGRYPDDALRASHGHCAMTTLPPRHPGRRGRPDRFWALVAEQYVEALERAPRRVNEELAERLMAHPEFDLYYTASHAKELVSMARTRRPAFLTSPHRGEPGRGKGKPGGALTDHAKAALART